MIECDAPLFLSADSDECRIMHDAYRRVCALLIGQGGRIENADFRSRIADIIVDLNSLDRRGAEALARAALQHLAPLSGTQARHSS